MFKQVKSAVFWYYLYKFRRRVMFVSFLLILALFTNAIYSDVIEYLTLKQKLEYLEVAIICKWIVIISSLLFSIYLILTAFKKEKRNEEKGKKINNKKDVDIKNNNSINKDKKFSKREQEFLNKRLKNKAQSLVER